MVSDRINGLITSIRIHRLSSRYDKIKDINRPLTDFQTKIEVNATINMKKIIERISNKTEFPTIEVLRDRILTGIDMIYQEHSWEDGILSHKCCFDKYKKDIESLILILLNPDYIYAHRSVIEAMRR